MLQVPQLAANCLSADAEQIVNIVFSLKNAAYYGGESERKWQSCSLTAKQ